MVGYDFVARFTVKEYLGGKKLPKYCQILVSEDDNPPQYANRSGFRFIFNAYVNSQATVHPRGGLQSTSFGCFSVEEGKSWAIL